MTDPAALLTGGQRLPRLVVAAPASGHGKTTVATGLMAALCRRGLEVSGHKVGPDYIDPGYHALATGRPGRNLDPHLVGERLLAPLLLHGARGADVAVVEGVMGLYDGRIGGDGFASTAHVAGVLQAPVVLVVDISHASRSIGAVVRGMCDFDPSVRVAGVILNMAGSQRHADEVVRAIDLPVLGVLHRDDGIAAPSRHLGLVPAAERDDAASALERLADRVCDRVDLAGVMRIARSAPPLLAAPWDPAEALAVDSPQRFDGAVRPDAVDHGRRPVVAVAGGRAFTFRYAETDELLRVAGCDLVTFDPLVDRTLPPGTSAIYLGGGFPEVHAADLAANTALRHHLAAAVRAGVPTVAECAGLLYLCDAVESSPMAGVVPARARMAERLTLSYRTVDSPTRTLLGRPGEQVTGHEFHRTTTEPGAADDHVWSPAWSYDAAPTGFASGTVHASYLHVHWAGHPQLARRFAEAARAAVGLLPEPEPVAGPVPTPGPRSPEPPRPAVPEVLLRHHGDAETGGDLLDFAVNVHDVPRPEWLDAALRASLDEVGTYPSPVLAEEAVGRRHGRPPADVLATAGAAEAFTLVARLRPWRRPVVVHPQFTEPDVALRMAGHEPVHVLCDASRDFALDPRTVPDDADLVVVGNPTNPTGVLHPAATVRALLRPGRLVVVDEAFMDAVPGEPGSLAGQRLPGLLVVRSLTKHWAIPGVRAGYVLGEPVGVRALRDLQTPWSVSTTAACAMVACSDERARAEAERRAVSLAAHRAHLEEALCGLGVPFVPGRAPFVLARVGVGAHARLRAQGIAVRRADTFPGLGPEWVRIAVRDPARTRPLLDALVP